MMPGGQPEDARTRGKTRFYIPWRKYPSGNTKVFEYNANLGRLSANALLSLIVKLEKIIL